MNDVILSFVMKGFEERSRLFPSLDRLQGVSVDDLRQSLLPGRIKGNLHSLPEETLPLIAPLALMRHAGEKQPHVKVFTEGMDGDSLLERPEIVAFKSAMDLLRGEVTLYLWHLDWYRHLVKLYRAILKTPRYGKAWHKHQQAWLEALGRYVGALAEEDLSMRSWPSKRARKEEPELRVMLVIWLRAHIWLFSSLKPALDFAPWAAGDINVVADFLDLGGVGSGEEAILSRSVTRFLKDEDFLSSAEWHAMTIAAQQCISAAYLHEDFPTLP
jgi:hypothetical protein